MTVVAILGMHRSGTSWLAGSLESMGLALGEVETSNPHNRRGNRENSKIQALHADLFRLTGGSWRSPPGRVRFGAMHVEAAREIAAEMGALGEPWGFKDPRTVFAIDLWREAVPDLRLIGVFRHPISVAASLAARGGSLAVSRSDALRMWRVYNERLLEELLPTASPLLAFDSPIADLEAKLCQLAPEFGIAGSRPPAFSDTALVHHDPPGRVPWRLRSTWHDLNEHAY